MPLACALWRSRRASASRPRRRSSPRATATTSRGHELLEHTADVGLRVWAATLDDLFVEAALGQIDVMGSATGKIDRVEHVSLDASDLEALFVDWLSEVLFLFDARGFVTRDARVTVDRAEVRLETELHGSDESGFVQHGPAVKAVTYHDVALNETDSGFEARVYLDV